MSLTAAALLGYIAWTFLLASLLVGLRAFMVVSGKRAANAFHPSGEDVSAFVHRLTRAHANCYEHFPIFGGLLLFSLATDLTVVTNRLALWLLAARLAQAVTHLVSTSAVAVQVRFAFFIVQLGIAAWWIVRLATSSFAT